MRAGIINGDSHGRDGHSDPSQGQAGLKPVHDISELTNPLVIITNAVPEKVLDGL